MFLYQIKKFADLIALRLIPLGLDNEQLVTVWVLIGTVASLCPAVSKAEGYDQRNEISVGD
jgi:hypothetical protein